MREIPCALRAQLTLCGYHLLPLRVKTENFAFRRENFRCAERISLRGRSERISRPLAVAGDKNTRLAAGVLKRIDTDGRPCLEPLIQRASQFIQRAESEVGQGFFVGCYLVILQFKAMYEAEVDGTDFVGVVVDDGEELLGGGAGKGDFLTNFALHAGKVGGDGVSQAVDGIDMAADAERHFVVQSGFAAFGGAGIGQDAALVAENGVGDELLEFGALFGQFAVHVAGYPGLQESGQIILRVESDAVESAYGFKGFARNDQYLFSIIT